MLCSAGLERCKIRGRHVGKGGDQYTGSWSGGVDGLVAFNSMDGEYLG
jgi:hypothetical protein